MNLTRPNSSIADMEAARYRKRRSFRTGFTIEDEREVLLWEDLHGGTGNYYEWRGNLPKVVPPNSTPGSTGGISELGWVDVGDANYFDDVDEELENIRDDIQTLAGQIQQGGKSAYQSYLDTTTDNPPLTEAEWIASLKGATGPGLTILGSFGSTSDLPLTENNPGDAYIVNEQMWVWDGTQWVPVGEVGPEGKSAYEVWKSLPGNRDGTVQEFLASIKGDPGNPGPEGKKGDPGQNAAPLVFKGKLTDIADLPTADQSNISWAYTINTSLYVSTGTSWVNIGDIQGPQGDIGPQGIPGLPGQDGVDGEPGQSLLIKDELDDPSELPASGEVGDAYVIGRDLYVWLNDATSYKNIGPFVGPAGVAGADGQGVNPKGELADISDLPTTGNTVGDMYYIKGHSFIYDGNQFIDFGDLAGPAGADGVDGKDGTTITSVIAQTSDIPEGKHVDLTFTLSDNSSLNSGFDLKDIQGNSVNALGQLPSVGDLPSVNNSIGDMYYVTGVAYIWNGSVWINMGSVIGPAGADGPQGVPGIQGIQGIPGPEGKQGIQGNDGPPGPGATILGSFTDPSQLPTTADVGDCYLVNGDFWVYDGTQWINAGPFVGPTGPQGPQGDTGPQGNDGQQGLKGDQGTIWIALARDPNPATDGRVNDYFINTQTLQFFKKTSTTNWASLGYMGGGNVYDAPSDNTQYVRENGAWVAPDVQEAAKDGNIYARKDGAWVTVSSGITDAPNDGGYYLRSDSNWQRLNRYDLSITSATTTLDVSTSQVFNVSLATAKTLQLTNLPAGRAMAIVIIFTGNANIASWSNTISWTDGVSPSYSTNWTLITLLWDGTMLRGFKSGGTNV